jgi:hypothetical protein
LYRINETNGAVLQDIGPLNDAAGLNYGISGLAFHPTTGVLYGSTHNLQEANPATLARLVTINPATAQVTVVGEFNAGNEGRATTMADIEFNAAGQLFGVGSVGGPQLYSINTGTGKATVIGNTGLTSTGGGGLAIGPSGAIFGTPTGSRFGRYDSAGLYTNITNPAKPAGGGAYAALAFDGNVLYGLNSGPGSPPPTHLAIIDRVTGAVTDVGASVNALDAIAFQSVPIPEPGTVALMLGPALLGFGTRRRSMKQVPL